MVTSPSSSPFRAIKACVFDAYGTLLDINAAAQRCQEDLGGKAQPLADLWRLKQLQYTWLSSLMGRHRDFYELTGAALDFAMDTLDLDDQALRAKLMALYEVLDAYPEVAELLGSLKQAGLKTAILSNGSPKMLATAVKAAGIKESLNAIISIEEAGIYKPSPSVYQLAVERLGVAKEISVSSPQMVGMQPGRPRLVFKLPGSTAPAKSLSASDLRPKPSSRTLRDWLIW